MNVENLRICVDLPWDASACMGTGAYSETMVRALAKVAPRTSITLIVPLGTPRRIDLPNIAYASLPETEGLREGTRQIVLPSFLDSTQADCLFAPASLVPAIKVCPTVATIHDLAFETESHLYAPALADYLDRWFPATLAGADRLVAISEPVKQDLLFRKRVDSTRVVLIEQPIRDIFREALSAAETEAELRQCGITGPYFFHVSNLGAHKNMEFGVRVFAEFLKRHPGSRHQLLFAGGGYAPSAPPDLVGIARSLQIGERVKYVGKVPDRTLKALYQRCEAFFFPSLVEGWGLPVVEARALGARVLASPHVPSALPREKLPLEIESWVSRLEAAPESQPPAEMGSAEEAGQKLLSALREAISLSPRLKSPSVPSLTSGPPRVAIRGDWYSPSGFGQAARGVYKALESTGLRPMAALVPKDAIQDKRLWRDEVSLRRGPADLWIHHGPPELIDFSLPGKHSGFFFWETDRLPGGTAKILSNLDEVWAPSTFVAEVLGKSGVTAPIVQISPPVDTELYRPGARRTPSIEVPDGFDPSWTVFLYVGTWDPRKRPDLLVRSFSRAFSRRDRALLVLKSYVTGNPAKDREILGHWTAQSRESDAHVTFIPEVLSPTEMADLFRFATAFATASRGEGYCLPAVQAMSCGNPVLASGWSAFADYVGVPVNHSVEPIPSEVALPGYSPDQRWAVIDEADLTRKLRWVHEHRDQARALGQKGREWVLENASMSVVGRRLTSRIQDLCRKNIHPQPLEMLI